MVVFPEPTNMTTFYEYVWYNNMITGGWFGNLLLISVFAVAFIIAKTRGYTSERAFMGGAWIVSITAIFFRIAGFVGDFAMFLSFAAAGLGIIWLLTTHN